ncbi:MAG: hypothetical protein JW860_06140 [Sedimentisphaerales bacterium]|nr:hypothetical protein [Sedimentisphaerales bacterium]
MDVLNKKSLLLTIIALCLMIGFGQTVSAGGVPEVLKEMPADSMVVIATHSLDKISPKINAFAGQLGLSTPGLNVEDMLWQQLGLMGLVDPAGGFGLCIRDIMQGKNAAVGYIPVNNTQQAIEALKNPIPQNTPLPGDIHLTMFGTYVKPSGKYLLMAANPEILSTISASAKGVKLNSVAQEVFSQSDEAAFINLATLMPMAKGMIMMGAMSDPEIQKHPCLGQIITMMSERVGEIQDVSIGINVDQTGINLKIYLQSQSGTTLSKYLSNHPATNLSRLAGLPGQNYILAGTMNLDKRIFIDPANAIIDAVAADTTLSDKVKPSDLEELKNLFTKMAVTKGGFGMYMPTASTSAPAPGFKQIIIGNFENARDCMKHYDEMCSLITRISTQAGFPIVMSYKKSAGEANGVTYDELTTDMSQLPMSEQEKQGMAAVYGGQMAFVQQIAFLDDNLFVSTSGAGTINEALTLAKNKSAGLSSQANITNVAGNLPDKANVIIFVDINKYMQFVMQMMKASVPQEQMMPMMMMAGIFSQVKGTVGATVLLEDGTIKNEAYLPIDMIQSLVQIGQMMGGGMGPGGMPPSGPPPGSF